jgi:peptide deformylase
MTLKEIITVPHPTLRKKARKVTDFGDDLQTLIDDMLETLQTAVGVGLAAPQVNVSKRLILIEYREEDGDDTAPPKSYIVVNPEITRPSREKVEGPEGCLSIPGLMGDVERNVAVTIKGMDRHGRKLKIKAKDWLARIFQHEIDHLDGVLFTDLATQVWQPEEIDVESSMD